MKRDTLSFASLQFSKLFVDYCKHDANIRPFFAFDPFHPDVYRHKKNPECKRVQLKEILDHYNPDELLHQNARNNLNALVNDPESRTIVTGQQLNLAGGPLFTLYKILTCISESKKAAALLGKTVVPIFWLADEDHDTEEVAEVAFPLSDEWMRFDIRSELPLHSRVGDIMVTDKVVDVLGRVSDKLPRSEFNTNIVELLERSYVTGRTHARAFSELILRLFSKYGLLVIGSSIPAVKELLRHDIIALLEKSEDMHVALESMSGSVERLYHRQATVSSSNWFIINEVGKRVKLNRIDNGWESAEGSFYTQHELVELVASEPRLISPNVFMRPLLQELLLPNLAYIAGPGEIAYYAQMRKLYEICDIEPPVIIPRFSATLMDGAIRKYLDELPFDISDYSNRIEDLESAYIQKSNDFNTDAMFVDWSEQISAMSGRFESDVVAIDPTLRGTLKRVENEQINSLNQLKSKLIKALKSRQDVQIKRISRVQLNLFPNRNLQERSISFIYYLNKYGTELSDILLRYIDEVAMDKHYIIDL